MSKLKSFKKGINFEPQAADPSSPADGDIQYSDGTVRAKGLWQYKDGAWAAIGAGGGGLDVFLAEDFGSNKVSTLTSGQNATFDNGGSLGGALADEEANQIAGDRSAKYTTNATPGSSTNDFFYLSTITLDDKQKGNDIGLSFYYTWDGSDDLVEVVIYDDTNNTVLSSSLDLLKAKSNPTRYSTSVYVPTSCNALKVGFHHTGASEASKVLVFDDVELSTNPFVYKNILDEDYFVENILSANVTSSVTISDFTVSDLVVGETYEVKGQLFIRDNDSNADVIVGEFRNGSTVVGSFSQYTSNPVNGATHYHHHHISFRFTATSTSFTVVGTNISGATGQYVGGDGTKGANGSFLQISKVRDTSEHVVTPTKNTLTNWDTYTATTQGFGTVTSPSYEWRRVGENIQVRGFFGTGTTTATEARIGLPTGLTIGGVTSTKTPVPGMLNRDATSNDRFGFNATKGDDYVTLFRWSGSAATNLYSDMDGNTISSGNNVYFYFEAPIAEWAGEGTFLAATPKNKIQTKYLSSNQTTGTFSDLTFNNLVVGRWYEVSGQISMVINPGSGTTAQVNGVLQENGNTVARYACGDKTDSATSYSSYQAINIKFKATGSSVTVIGQTANSGSVEGDGTKSLTYLQLTELAYYEETDRF